MLLEVWMRRIIEEELLEEKSPAIEEIFAVCEQVKQVQEWYTWVYVPDVHALLLQRHNGEFPKGVVFLVLKVAEYFGKCKDVGEGHFSWFEKL